MGTDNLSRDLLSRVIYGARVSVIIGLAAPALSTLLGIVIGVTSGYTGGKFDLVVQRFVDAVMCLPWLLLLMVLMSLLGTSMWTLILCMGAVWGVTGSRFARSVVISIKENVYVAAAQAIGCPTSRILTRHILPNIMAPMVIGFTASVPGVILAEASLSFLGFGIPPPEPSWGGMLSGSGRTYMFLNPYIVIWPGLALSTVVYGINMFGDAVRDLLDPRLRGGAGRYGARVKKEATKKSEPSVPEGLTKK
ncbi:Oligopeptide transport system permease protein OppC [subsurface metagenome]